MLSTAFIGAGFIADVHAEALAKRKDARLAAVVDVSEGRRTGFAKRWKAERTFGSLEEMLDAGGIDVAHVLTPPATHYAVAKPLLEAGVSVFLEKPMAETDAECAELQAAAAKGGAKLRVNQNFIRQPAHARLADRVTRGDIGPVTSCQLRYVMPLRQLAARALGHWMFDTPLNLLLEQAVHPLSQIADVMGPIEHVSAVAMPPAECGEGVKIATGWLVNLQCTKGPAQLHIALGASYPVWTLTVVGPDGMLEADMISAKVTASKPGAYLEFYDRFRDGVGRGLSLIWQSKLDAARYLGAQVKILGRADPFFRSIKGNVDAFYDDLAKPSAEDLDGSFGRALVKACEDIAADAAPDIKPVPKVSTPDASARYDAVVLGGTGFIGAALVRQLTDAGKRVAVAARSVNNLSDLYRHPNVGVFRGDMRDAAFMADLAGRAPVLVNLAHGGGGEDFEAIRAAMVGGAVQVAEAAKSAKVEHLLFVSSIAALYLGDPDRTITAETPVDPRRDERADYARAKTYAEDEMMRWHREEGLPISIHRPGVVVGAGGPPFHSGLGLFNSETYCLGWNAGKNALPFVLVDDVASALILAMEKPELAGRAFNLVGDARPNAREYVAALADATGRPLRFRPQSIARQQAGEVVKWSVKRIAGRNVPFPSVYDLKSRGLVSPFDTSMEKQALGWAPVADRGEFQRRAFAGL